jgi:cyclophilin family peptidyl-prolyl cis-trans isomerase
MTPRGRARWIAMAAVLTFVVSACARASLPTPRPACPSAAPNADEASAMLVDADRAVVQTSKGEFTMELYGEAAPIATANFVALARCGFYDGITFHRVLGDFVAQAGDPQTRENRGDFNELGTGGPGYRFVIEAPADGLNYDRYVVAMANAGGSDTNGSQFFIDLADLDARLPRSYTIFGKVMAGTEVVDAIGLVPTSGERGVPLDPIIIRSITIQPAPAESPSPG